MALAKVRLALGDTASAHDGTNVFDVRDSAGSKFTRGETATGTHRYIDASGAEWYDVDTGLDNDWPTHNVQSAEYDFATYALFRLAVGNRMAHIEVEWTSGTTMGFNFRATNATTFQDLEGAGQVYVLATDTYPTTRGGYTFGWVSNTSIEGRDRDATNPPEVAGIHFRDDVSGTNDFQVDPPASVPTAIRTDNFNRGDGAIGTPSDGGSAWEIGNGTMEVADNVALFHSEHGVTPGVGVLECSTADTSAAATVVTQPVSAGIVARYADTNNYLVLQYTTTDVVLRKVVAGVFTELDTAAFVVDIGDRVRIECLANDTINGYVNGALIVTASDAAGSTNTKFGLWVNSATDNDQFDNFNIGDGGNPLIGPGGLVGGRLIGPGSLVR